MVEYPRYIKNVLMEKIKEISSHPELYCYNPGSDFTRNRKLNFEQMLKLIISMEGGSIKKELLSYFDYDVDTVTSSAFIQQRGKIKPQVFEHLLREFVDAFPSTQLFRGFRLLACDGSNFTTASNPKDVGNHYGYLEGIRKFNMVHLNALYDLCNRRYIDATIQPGYNIDERGALITMLNRYQKNQSTIIVADRGYTAYKMYAYAERNGFQYVIRAKEREVFSLLNACALPYDSDFDYTLNITLTCHQRKQLTSKLGYKYVSKKYFEYFNEEGFHQMTLRAVRIELGDGNYEYLITNLPVEEFDVAAIKELYHLRWGIKTSFRELKYAIGTTHFHSKKALHIHQEIFAKLILYNFCELITTHVIIKEMKTKHIYQLNYTIAIHICKFFLRRGERNSLLDVEALIQKELLPVRAHRKYPRKKYNIAPVSFLYRVA